MVVRFSHAGKVCSGVYAGDSTTDYSEYYMESEGTFMKVMTILFSIGMVCICLMVCAAASSGMEGGEQEQLLLKDEKKSSKVEEQV